jgi:hypothetical protein
VVLASWDNTWYHHPEHAYHRTGDWVHIVMAVANVVVVGVAAADVVVVVVADRRMDAAVLRTGCCGSHRTIAVVVPLHKVAVDVADAAAARWDHPGGAELPYHTDDATVEEPVADSASDWTVVVAVVARKIRMMMVVVMVNHQLHGVAAVELRIARMVRVVIVPESSSSSWMVERGAEEAVTPWIVVAAAVVVVVAAAVDRPMLVLVAKHLLVAAFPHDHRRIRRLVDWDCCCCCCYCCCCGSTYIHVRRRHSVLVRHWVGTDVGDAPFPY